MINVKSKLIHPNYNTKPYLNDIALLQLSQDLEFNDFIKPIKLSENDKDIEPSDCKNVEILVAGWGEAVDEIPNEPYQKLEVKYPKILRKEKLELVDMKACKKLWNRTNHFYDDFVICARSLISNIPGTCSGDSGGPLMKVDLKNKEYVAIGIGKSNFYF